MLWTVTCLLIHTSITRLLNTSPWCCGLWPACLSTQVSQGCWTLVLDAVDCDPPAYPHKYHKVAELMYKFYMEMRHGIWDHSFLLPICPADGHYALVAPVIWWCHLSDDQYLTTSFTDVWVLLYKRAIFETSDLWSCDYLLLWPELWCKVLFYYYIFS